MIDIKDIKLNTRETLPRGGGGGLKLLLSVFINGFCLLSRFHFTRCRYFLVPTSSPGLALGTRWFWAMSLIGISPCTPH